jgi:hypothetical protein
MKKNLIDVSAELSKLGKKLGVEIPLSLSALYAKGNGEEPLSDCLGFRLMSTEEVLNQPFENILGAKRTEMLQRLGFSLWPFWTNDNSDYVAIFLSGPLIGYTCLVNHDDLKLDLACGDVETTIKKIKIICKEVGEEPLYPNEFRNRQRATAAAASRDTETINRLVTFLKTHPANSDDAPYLADYLRALFLHKDKEKMRKTLKEVGLGSYAVLRGAELMYAVAEGRIDEVKESLDAGVDVNWVEPCYGTIVGRAATYGKEDIVRLALAYGANVNHPENGDTIKYADAKDKNLKIFELLIEAGSDLTGEAGKCALENAINNKATKLEILLKANGAKF